MRFISALGVGISATFPIGIFFIVSFAIFVGGSAYYVKLKGFKSFVFLALVLLSPPILLLFERGNLDILIYFLVLMAALIMAKGWNFLSIIILFTSALFKFYPFILFVFQATLHRVKWWVFYLVLVIFGAIQILQDFRSGPGFINTAWTSFGAPVAGIYLEYLGVTLSYTYSLVLGIILLLITVLIIVQLQKSSNFFIDFDVEKILPNKNLRSIYICNLVVHISCYILGMSFDYRLIFLATSCIVLIFGSVISNHLRRIISATILLILWTSVNVPLLQPVGDVALGIGTAFFIIQLFRYWYSNQFGSSKLYLRQFLRFP